MRIPLFAPSVPVVRLGIRPDDPAAVVGPRPRGSRRPHTDATVARVRRLIEETALTYREIAERTGVACATICRWTRDGGWQRPLSAPRATDTVPSARASARLRRRMLAARLSALAERYVRELEESADVDLGKLAQALELLKMAKLAARPRRRRRAGEPGRASSPAPYETTPAGALAELHAAGIDVARAPAAAVAAYVASRVPAREEPFLARRGHRSARNRHHAWLLERG
jgi:transposase-like protein